jgi:hypothetical protein
LPLIDDLLLANILPLDQVQLAYNLAMRANLWRKHFDL